MVLTKADYESFLDQIAAIGSEHEQLYATALSWQDESADDTLARAGEAACIMAMRLGKGRPNLEISGGGLRLPDSIWRGFWREFPHLLRNAVDHGLETSSERVAAGKPEKPTLRLRARAVGENIIIAIADDGRGVDWDALAERAEKLGLAHESRKELATALFAQGLTTRDEVSELSGRGVGMAAVHQACDALGGRIEMESETGQGTEFRFVFPRERVTRSTKDASSSAA